MIGGLEFARCYLNVSSLADSQDVLFAKMVLKGRGETDLVGEQPCQTYTKRYFFEGENGRSEIV